jgi:hypothetical protein
VLELFSHINKRVRDRPSIPLPFDSLLALLPACAPFAHSFVLLYLRMAFHRLPPAEQGARAPALLCGSAYPAGVRDAVVGLGLRALAHADPAAPAARAAAWAGLAGSPEDAAAVAGVLADTMLYVRRGRGRPVAGRGGGGAGRQRRLRRRLRRRRLGAPGGLAPSAAARVLGADADTAAALAAADAALDDAGLLARKLGALRFVAAGVLPPAACLPSCWPPRGDGGGGVAAEAAEVAKRVLPGVDLEAPGVVAALFAAAAAPAGGGAPPGRGPAAALRGRRGRPARTALRAVFDLWFGAGGGPRLVAAGLRLASRVFLLAPPAALAPYAPVYLRGC